MSITGKIRKKTTYKYLAAFVAINLIVEIISPTMAWALTSGPSQPEIQSFEPVSTSEMVDLFTGDFTYNIPLFELPGPDGGYPFNLAYHSGIGMDQEASWVGLGWNINPGALTRQMRGIPDDFKGDKISYEMDMREGHTFGVSAGAGIEVFGADSKWGLSANLSVYYNNSRGFGYGIGGNLSTPIGASVGLNLDSQGGTSVNVSYSYELNRKQPSKDVAAINMGLGIGYSSKGGVSYSVSASLSSKTKSIWKESGENKRQRRHKFSLGNSSTLSAAQMTHVPASNRTTFTTSINVNFKQGFGQVGVYPHWSVGGFYNVSHLRDRSSSNNAYGLFYAQDGEKYDLGDYNRQLDKVIHRDDPTFPAPMTTPDFYSFTGQNNSGMFRVYRSDVGRFHDPYTSSLTAGGSIGVEVGGGKWGADVIYTHGKTNSGPWEEDAQNWYSKYAFANPELGFEDDYEQARMQLYGEVSALPTSELDWIGGEGPMMPDMIRTEITKHFPQANTYKNHGGNHTIDYSDRAADPNLPERVPRGTLVQQITNAQLLNGSEEILGEFKVAYYNGDEELDNATSLINRSKSSYSRIAAEPHHFAGFTINKAGGSRYIYALPAMNNTQVEASFSVPNEHSDCRARVNVPTYDNGELAYSHNKTDNFLNKTTVPKYAHSYLLTSILGSDYVDLNNDGPTEDDLGYWVKFNYVKIHDAYDWRAPYSGARYDYGRLSEKPDNKGSYIFGTKEIWYLASVETRTHIAVFEMSDRMDGLGANGELSNEIGTEKLKKINKIKLYSKLAYTKAAQNSSLSALQPIQTVHFEYDYSLCEGVENNNDLADLYTGYAPVPHSYNLGGKLTLKKVYITYEGNTRGTLSPYSFTYSTQNPSYNEYDVDRWGNYNPPPDAGHYCKNLDLPYVDQFDEGQDYNASTPEDFRETNADANSEAWHLTSINTPTGGEINIEYESDDYSFVQHRKATQMFTIDALKPSEGGGSNTNMVYDDNTKYKRIEFVLEEPIAQNLSYYSDKGQYSGAASANDVFEQQYLKGLKRDGKYQVYFKVRSNLRDGIYEYVAGYADVGDFGVVTGSTASKDLDGTGAQTCYTKGFIELNDINEYHPFAIAAFQHMRNNEPDLLNYNTKIDNAVGSGAFEKAKRVKSLLSFVSEIPKMFRNFHNHCAKKGFGKTVDLGSSVIRLCSPDGIKYGGGTRVKSIRLKDDLSINNEIGEYGQVYKYTMLDPHSTGREISSGVAQYEPQVGGDENALRFGKLYIEGTGVHTANYMFDAFPKNEGYYPGASVGYERVTVMSLHTANLLANQESAGTPTGVSVNEFYTARQFPTISSHTYREGATRRLWLPIPFIGQIDISRQHQAQGFAVQTNDMHGKPRSISNYVIDNTNEVIWNEPVSAVAYEYHAEEIIFDETTVWKLDNTLPVLTTTTHDGLVDHEKSDEMLGVQYEFFTEQRNSKSVSIQTGVQFNVEMFGAFPLPVPLPAYNQNTSELGLIITNKVIHRTGILKSTTATDGQSVVKTENIAYNGLTGAPVYTRTYNNWDEPVYSLTDMLDYAAVDNLGVQFTSVIDEFTGTVDAFPNNNHLYQLSETGKLIYPGDELILKATNGNKYKVFVVYDGTQGIGNRVFYSPNALTTEVSYEITVTRSGHRNYINLPVHAVSALADPLNTSNRSTNMNCYLNNQLSLKQVLSAQTGDLTEKWPIQNDQELNPYLNGSRGVLRAYRNLFYQAKRKQSSGLNLSVDGTFLDGNGGDWYHYPLIYPWRFYTGPATEGAIVVSDPVCDWNEAGRITQYDPWGHEVENLDALGIFSSAHYGYGGSLAMWVAANAQKKEVFFDGFETSGDSGLKYYTGECSGCYEDIDENFFDQIAHTGKQSLEVSESQFLHTDLDLVQGKEYVIGAWIKADTEGFTYNDGTDVGINVQFFNSTWQGISVADFMAVPSGEVIEGWQRIELKFEVPVDANLVHVGLTFLPGDNYNTVWFDDLRIFPAAGNMQSYVYDPENYRLLATLDQNNYASLYYYDEDGNLYLVKKETERGIMTLSESRSHKKEQ